MRRLFLALAAVLLAACTPSAIVIRSPRLVDGPSSTRSGNLDVCRALDLRSPYERRGLMSRERIAVFYGIAAEGSQRGMELTGDHGLATRLRLGMDADLVPDWPRQKGTSVASEVFTQAVVDCLAASMTFNAVELGEKTCGDAEEVGPVDTSRLFMRLEHAYAGRFTMKQETHTSDATFHYTTYVHTDVPLVAYARAAVTFCPTEGACRSATVWAAPANETPESYYGLVGHFGGEYELLARSIEDLAAATCEFVAGRTSR